jgi:hypothetical protein
MIPDSGKVFYPAAPYQNHGMFLQIVAYTGYIGGNFSAM